MSDNRSKDDVRQFYDQIGWKLESDGFYQNARYEDLRPVSADYIHRCHMRITPYFSHGGRLLLDAGCGPIQYPEYLTYSEKFDHRVCLDISITALQEARARIGDHGLFVVGDAANLPFAPDVFDGVVSLHTFHHLPLGDQARAWTEINRTLKSGKTAVVVNGWTESAMMKRWLPWMKMAEKVGRWIAVLRGKQPFFQTKDDNNAEQKTIKPTGTYVKKLDANWIREELPKAAPASIVQIRCWRSVSVRWLRALIHDPYGRRVLRNLFEKEDQRSEEYGEQGQYPMVILTKSTTIDGK